MHRLLQKASCFLQPRDSPTLSAAQKRCCLPWLGLSRRQMSLAGSLQLSTEQTHKSSPWWVVPARTPEPREDSWLWTSRLVYINSDGFFPHTAGSRDWFILTRIKEIAKITSCTVCCQSIKVAWPIMEILQNIIQIPRQYILEVMSGILFQSNSISQTFIQWCVYTASFIWSSGLSRLIEGAQKALEHVLVWFLSN